MHLSPLPLLLFFLKHTHVRLILPYNSITTVLTKIISDVGCQSQCSSSNATSLDLPAALTYMTPSFWKHFPYLARGTLLFHGFALSLIASFQSLYWFFLIFLISKLVSFPGLRPLTSSLSTLFCLISLSFKVCISSVQWYLSIAEWSGASSGVGLSGFETCFHHVLDL